MKIKTLTLILLLPVFALGLYCGGLIVKNTAKTEMATNMDCTTDLDCCKKNPGDDCWQL